MEPLKRGLGDSVVSRRALFKRASEMGLSAYFLSSALARAALKTGERTSHSLITLWLSGGPSQLETWDPHPGSRVGGLTQSVKTSVPGLAIAHLYPRVAEVMDSVSVVRSLVSKEGDHERGTYMLKTGFRPEPTLKRPSIGALLVHQREDPEVEIPQHVSLGPSPWPARSGFLDARFDAFKVLRPGRNLGDLKPYLKGDVAARQQRRLSNLQVVSSAFVRGREKEVQKTQHQGTIDRALKMMRSAELRAFELDDEPQAVVDAYGDSGFGRGCLVARRLVEEGVRAVEVTLGGFDSHVSNHEAHVAQAKVLDPALAALVKDLKTRDLLRSTIILCIGEFGRTPKINVLEGRDHWPSGFSCIIGGGGIRAGQVLGETDPKGEAKMPKNPVPVEDLLATVLKAAGVDPTTEIYAPVGRPVPLCEGTPIGSLLG